jgi:hypothetical protein
MTERPRLASVAFLGLLGAAPPQAAPPSGPSGGPALPKFVDVLPQSGVAFRHHFLDSESGSTYHINPYDHGSGVCVVDVDGDGRDDLYFLDFQGTNALYLNRGGFKFEDVTAKAGVAVARAIKVGAAFGDYDKDGDLDLYVTTYRGGNHLFRNQGGATFEDVSAAACVAYRGHSSGATWLDHDVDGDLDLFLCNIGKFTTDAVSKEVEYAYAGESFALDEIVKGVDGRVLGEGCVLYENQGDGTFVDATKKAGLGADEWNGDVAVSDVDLDGDPDLYVSNMFGPNHLFVNRGDGTFEDRTRTALGRTSWGGMGARFLDADGDPWPDLYVVDMHSDMGAIPPKEEDVDEAAKFDTLRALKAPGGKVIASNDETRSKWLLFGNTYFRNRGDGTFSEESAKARLETWWPWGIAVGDFNDDGAEDLFVPSGMGYPFYYWPNRLLVNDGAGRFVESSAKAGLEPPPGGPTLALQIRGRACTRSSRAAATGDLDGDGDLDLVVNNFNHEPYLFRNDSPPGRSLRLRLRDRAKSPAFGARVVVTAGDRKISRELQNAQGYLTQSSAVLHVGLGAATKVDQVEVFWPGKKTPQVVAGPALDTVVVVDEE